MKDRWKTIVFYALLYVCACGLLSRMMAYLMPEDLTGFASVGYPLYLGLLVLVACLLHIPLHEGGHLLFGLLTGYRFVSFRVFSFMVVKEQGKLRLRRLNVAGTGGQCLMAPPELRDGDFPVLLYNLGGPLVNLVCAWGCWVLLPMLPRYSVAANFCAAMCLSGLLAGLTNGIPLRTKLIDNDGRNALSLWKNREARIAFWCGMMVNAHAAQGQRVKDMPEEWFRLPTDDAMKNSLVASRAVSRCGWLMDQLRLEEAEALMDHLLSIPTGMVGVQRQLLTCDRICCELLGRCRGDVVLGYFTADLKQFLKTSRTLLPVIRTEYATALLLERDSARADRLRQAFDKAAKTWPYEVDVISEEELMDLARNRAEESCIP